jgi:hypothetical protein
MSNPKDHSRDRNWLEELFRRVPGFRGYLEKEYRRESDKLQRDWMADALERSKASLEEVGRKLADAGAIKTLPELDRLRGRLDKLVGRLRHAPHGYSGFFDLVQVDEALLDEVYAFDVAMMDAAGQLASETSALRHKAEGEVTAELEHLMEAAAELDRRIDRREDLLKGVG